MMLEGNGMRAASSSKMNKILLGLVQKNLINIIILLFLF
jgi:hypothetical protein